MKGSLTNVLSRETIGGTKPFNVVCVITERMDFVRDQVEEFHVWIIFSSGSTTISLLVLFFRFSSTVANAGCLLAWEPFCVVL